MDDSNLTIEEYIRLEEEKARKCEKMFNWQTATYGKIRIDDDLHDLSSVEAEFPTIVINDNFPPQDELQYEYQVCTLINDEIDSRISFDESDDEDYTIICDTNSFSYKMISVNNLKTDSENDYEKVTPSILSPEPVISYFDDLDFLNDFENEFPAIVYNDAQTCKSNLIIEPILNTQHIDIFDDKTSLSDYDEEEQNVLYFNDLTECLNLYTLVFSSIDFADMAPLPPREQRHKFLRYEGLEYTDSDISDFESRLERIYTREHIQNRIMQHRLEPLVKKISFRFFCMKRMLMEHRDEVGVSVFTSRAWRRLFDIRGPLLHELILEFFSTFRFGQAILDVDTLGTLQFQLGGARRRMSWREFIVALGLHMEEEMQTAGFGAYWAGRARKILDKGDLRDYWMGISSAGDFLGTAQSYTLIRDLILRFCHQLIACSIVGRKILGELTVIAPELLVIDMAELVGLHIYVELDDTWAWVAMGPERQPDDAAGAPAEAEDALIIDEGGQADPAPSQAPQQPSPPPPAPARTIPQRLGRLEEDVQGLRRDVGSLRGLMERSMTDQGRFSKWMMTCMTQLMEASGLTYQAFDGSFWGSSPATFQRWTRQRTGKASTSPAQQDPQQPDP
nr:hypothetical protein [Tanacetum cinerariifolium]